MLPKATQRPLRGFFLFVLSCGFIVSAAAQTQAPLHGPQETLLKTTVLTAKDSAEDVNSKGVANAGIGSVLAKYGKANQLYYKMIDSLAKVIFKHPFEEDSAGLSYANEWVGTPNMGLRRPNFVVIHHTANNSCAETLQAFTTPGGREASAHYVICKDGTVHHMLSDLLRSHHAGESKWGNNTDLNSSSIGIEMDNNGYQPFPEAQMNSLTVLLDRLKTTYKIPASNFIGHGDIAPTRKVDPSILFPWKALSEKGFGLWYDDTTSVQVPENFDYLLGLRIIGYDISAPASALAAFKRHFMNENSTSINAEVRKLIYMVYRKFE